MSTIRTVVALFLFSSGTIFSQNKTITYNPDNDGLSRPYLYFWEPFEINGPSEFGGVKYDSIRMSIYKTDRYLDKQIGGMYDLQKEIKIEPSAEEIKQGIISKSILKNEKGEYLLQMRKETIKKDNNERKIDTVSKRLKNWENSEYKKEIVENAVFIPEVVYSKPWTRKTKEGAQFSFTNIKDLWFNWNYIIKFKFYANKEVFRSISTQTAAASSVPNSTLTNVDAKGTSNTITITYTNTPNGSTVTTTGTITTNNHMDSLIVELPPYRAYDIETIESKFAATTGFGAAFVGPNPKNCTAQFINFVGLRMHFNRIFPSAEDPYILGFLSRFSAGVGVVTTALNYQNKSLEGFVGQSNLKPVIFLGGNFNKYVGITTGVVIFRQNPRVTTSTVKRTAIAPFVTLSVSTEIINYYKTKTGTSEPPKANQ